VSKECNVKICELVIESSVEGVTLDDFGSAHSAN
jgi:hypothetical protein